MKHTGHRLITMKLNDGYKGFHYTIWFTFAYVSNFS